MSKIRDRWRKSSDGGVREYKHADLPIYHQLSKPLVFYSENGKPTFISAFIRIENLFQLSTNLTHALPAFIETSPVTGDSPTFRTSSRGSTDGLYFKLISLMENDHEVDKPAKARVPCRDTFVRITGHVYYKKGG
jgi:hypothetical protein